MKKKYTVKIFKEAKKFGTDGAHITVPKCFLGEEVEIRVYKKYFECKICKQAFLNVDYCLDCGKEKK